MKRPLVHPMILRTLSAGLAALVLLVGGCAHVADSEKDEKNAALVQRVRAFHQARMDARWDEVYEYFYSEYRNQRTKTQFLSVPKDVNIVQFEIGEIRMTDARNTAEVSVKEDVSIQGYEIEGGFKAQTWVEEGGIWFLKFDPNASPVQPAD